LPEEFKKNTDELVKRQNSLLLSFPRKRKSRFSLMVPRFRGHDVWTPRIKCGAGSAAVYPCESRGRSDGFETFYETINVERRIFCDSIEVHMKIPEDLFGKPDTLCQFYPQENPCKNSQELERRPYE